MVRTEGLWRVRAGQLGWDGTAWALWLKGLQGLLCKGGSGGRSPEGALLWAVPCAETAASPASALPIQGSQERFTCPTLQLGSGRDESWAVGSRRGPLCLLLFGSGCTCRGPRRPLAALTSCQGPLTDRLPGALAQGMGTCEGALRTVKRDAHRMSHSSYHPAGHCRTLSELPGRGHLPVFYLPTGSLAQGPAATASHPLMRAWFIRTRAALKVRLRGVPDGPHTHWAAAPALLILVPRAQGMQTTEDTSVRPPQEVLVEWM